MTNQPSVPLEEHRRHAYLHAIGVPIWVHRKTKPRVVHTRATTTEETAQPQPQSQRMETKQVIEALSATLSSAPKKPVKHTSVKTPLTTSLEAIDCSHSTWDELTTQITDCQSCNLCHSRNQAVQGSGDTSAQCLIIGDTPSSDDDRKGHPFMGNPGQLLTNMLLAINLPRKDVYLTQATKCRTTNDRMPSADELAQCSHYLYRQIALIKPDKILILGRTTAQFLLQQKAPLSTLRGKVHTLPRTDIPTAVTYHPRILLKQPKDKCKAWEDLKLFKSITSS